MVSWRTKSVLDSSPYCYFAIAKVPLKPKITAIRIERVGGIESDFKRRLSRGGGCGHRSDWVLIRIEPVAYPSTATKRDEKSK